MSTKPAINPDEVQEALTDFASSLQIACDIVSVRRGFEKRRKCDNCRRCPTCVDIDTPPKASEHLRHGAFLTAYAAFDGYVNSLLTRHGRPSNRGVPMNADKIRTEFDKHLGVANITANWTASMRCHPSDDASIRHAKWELLSNGRTKALLADAKSIRDSLAHSGTLGNVTNNSRTLSPLSTGGFSMRLMWVEGWIFAVQDIAGLTAQTLYPDVVIPVWPYISRTGVSKRPPDHAYIS